MARDSKRSWRGLGWLTVLLAACSNAQPLPPAPAPPEAGSLVRRHYDQVCRVQTGDRPVVQAYEIFDTVGLSEELAAVGAQPLPPDPNSPTPRWRTLDFISRYSRDGQPGILGVWETSLDSTSALHVEGILRERARAISGLLEPEGFRTVAVLSNRPTLEVAPAVACTPHVRHVRGERPRGLPDGMILRLVAPLFRPRPGAANAQTTATIRVRLDREGTVTAVEPLAGDSVAIAAARNILSQLQFDPALRNGEAVLGEVVYSFRPSAGYVPR